LRQGLPKRWGLRAASEPLQIGKGSEHGAAGPQHAAARGAPTDGADDCGYSVESDSTSGAPDRTDMQPAHALNEDGKKLASR
jgi:hypothetical protein